EVLGREAGAGQLVAVGARLEALPGDLDDPGLVDRRENEVAVAQRPGAEASAVGNRSPVDVHAHARRREALLRAVQLEGEAGTEARGLLAADVHDEAPAHLVAGREARPRELVASPQEMERQRGRSPRGRDAG